MKPSYVSRLRTDSTVMGVHIFCYCWYMSVCSVFLTCALTSTGKQKDPNR